MMNKQLRLILLFVFISTIVVQWLFGNGAVAAGEREIMAVENLSDTVTSDPKTAHKKRVYENIVGMQFVRISPGKFIMGSPSNESGRDVYRY